RNADGIEGGGVAVRQQGVRGAGFARPLFAPGPRGGRQWTRALGVLCSPARRTPEVPVLNLEDRTELVLDDDDLGGQLASAASSQIAIGALLVVVLVGLLLLLVTGGGHHAPRTTSPVRSERQAPGSSDDEQGNTSAVITDGA